MNGFIIHVLGSKLLQKENGIAQHALPIWLDERDENKVEPQLITDNPHDVERIKSFYIVNTH